MSEDEAFIRAIVTHPGDDTPRLVYADWLDDRADPRGPYLRAEHEWAKKPTPGALKKVQKLVELLDAVWVARVSRPPLGVCCRHVRFDAPRTTEDLIGQYEQVIGVTLPPGYRAFLLNYNGGTPNPNCFPVPGGRKNRLEAIRAFFPLTERRPEDFEDPLPRNLGDAHDWLYGSPLMGLFSHARRPFIPVAWFGEVSGTEESVAGVQAGSRVLLGIRGSRRGEVHMITRDAFNPGDKTRALASSFSEFLAALQGPAE